MINASTLSLSNSMQMYLVKIKRLESDSKPVPLSVLADSLNISPVSVNEMCRKLDEMDLVQYVPYKGALLTKQGDHQAQTILRRHRLWEVFLVNKLRFKYEQAHEMADILEHATPKELADRLDAYLDFPRLNPDGKPIPAGDDAPPQIEQTQLTDLPAGASATYSINGTDAVAAEFFRANGIASGAALFILARSEKFILIRIGQQSLHLSTQIAQGVRVFADPLVQEHTLKQTIDSYKERNMENTQTKTRTLKDLKVGESGVVVRVAGSGSVKQRMMDMGLVPGSQVTVVRVAPLGDPIEFTLKGYNLSLRKSEAKDIFIEA